MFLRSIGTRRDRIPSEGSLLVDTVAQRMALERQDEAIKTLYEGMSVLPSLKRILLHPNETQEPEISGRPCSEEFSLDKAKVLDAALGLRNLMVVQGPPGTGKTTLIAEVVTRYLKENPRARVLIAAQTHIAIDHVISKLLSHVETAGKIVRIARADDDKVSEKVREALLNRCVETWCSNTASTARQYIKERGVQIGLNARDIELCVRLEAILSACQQKLLIGNALTKAKQDHLIALNGALAAASDEITKLESATTVTLNVAELEKENERIIEHVYYLRNELRQLGPDGSELADTSETELREWLSILVQGDEQWQQFRGELELQVAWLDLLGQSKQFEEIVLRSASVVAGTCVGLGSNEAFSRTEFDLCIIDEASKAAASEALIPMVRSRRCLIVGDPKQLPPFDNGPLNLEGYSSEEVKETLLDYLLPSLPSGCVYQLTHQHRMCKSIGDLISKVFYNSTLVNERPDSDRPKWLRKTFPKPIVWIDTKNSPQKRKGYTYVNTGEQEEILNILMVLQREANRCQASISVSIITGYAAQAYALDARIQKNSFKSLSIEVATVDSFQGRETDVCLFSVTLSNTNDFLGFLRSMKRLNVALSRPKDLLIIVGDQSFCYQTSGENPFVNVIDYIEENPTSCETRHVNN